MGYNIIRPRRGIKSLWDTFKGRVYKNGEMLVESPESGVGSGPVNIKFGDGVTDYEHLPYAVLAPTDTIEKGNKAPLTSDAAAKEFEKVIQPDKGGTGQITLNASADALINALPIGSDTPKDDDYIITQYVNGNSLDKPNYYRRKVSALWSYIKGKADSVYLKLTGGTLSDNVTIKKTSGLADFILESGARKGGLEVSSGTESFGLWDFTNDAWVLVSHKDQSVQIPHSLSVPSLAVTSSLSVAGKWVAIGDNSLFKRGTKSVTFTSYGGGQVLESSIKVTVPSGYTPLLVSETRFDYPQTWETVYLRLDNDGTITWHVRCNATGGGGTFSSPAAVEVVFIKSTFIGDVTI